MHVRISVYKRWHRIQSLSRASHAWVAQWHDVRKHALISAHVVIYYQFLLSAAALTIRLLHDKWKSSNYSTIRHIYIYGWLCDLRRLIAYIHESIRIHMRCIQYLQGLWFDKWLAYTRAPSLHETSFIMKWGLIGIAWLQRLCQMRFDSSLIDARSCMSAQV